MKQRTQKRIRNKGTKIVTTLVTAMLLALVPMAVPAFAVGNPPTLECGIANPLYNKFQINNGDVGQLEASNPPGQIIDLTANGDGTFDYELTDDDYVIVRIILKHGQTEDIVLTNPGPTGTLEPAPDISHITFCFVRGVAVGVDVQPCTEGTETTPVQVTIPGDNATITIRQGGEVVDTVTGDETLNLPAGDYTWTAVPDVGFAIVGDDEGSFTVENCEEEPTPVDVAVDLQPCTEGTETTPVEVTIPGGNATITIRQGGEVVDTVTGDETLNLPAGDYTWSAEPGDGFVIEGDAEGSFTVEDCEEEPTLLNVDVDVLPCEGQASPVDVTVPAGATLTILQGGEVVETVTSSTTLDLEPGDYTWTAAADEGFVIAGNDEGSFTVLDCIDDVILRNATVDVDLGACDFTDDESQTPVTVNVNPTGGATVVLTDEGGESTVFNGSGGSADLLAGDYTYEVEAAEGFQLVGSPTGTLTAEDCEPVVLGVIERQPLARTGSSGLRSLTMVGVFLFALGMVLVRRSALSSVSTEAAGTSVRHAVDRPRATTRVPMLMHPARSEKRKRRWRT